MPENLNIDEYGNIFITTDKYEYMCKNGKMYVRPLLNETSEDEYFDYTDVEELF